MSGKLLAPDLVVAVFGAGTMGRGIAQVCAQAGLRRSCRTRARAQ